MRLVPAQRSLRASGCFPLSAGPFCAAVGFCCPPGFAGLNTDHAEKCWPLSLSFGPSPTNSRWLVSSHDGSTTNSIALAIADCLKRHGVVLKYQPRFLLL